MRRPPSMEPERFDVILCLSVTKWVHFAHGDEGVRRLFRRLWRRLRPGGLLVLEPQEWSSYKKKRHLTREIRETVAAIELRPESFASELEAFGFESCGVAAPPADAPKNFRRSVRLFRRPLRAPDADEERAAEEAKRHRKAKAASLDADAREAKRPRRGGS
eukprot:TRINITY_DN23263_c0_g1_i1.p2 TRINITY_DN23263_c0_g1~~TRINITY_DN23263_c0_g1_i1.p2  ORF type:complete len:161 (+),score=40.55 TRINITY_DN23263_c0_g1_i1:124-606(+)